MPLRFYSPHPRQDTLRAVDAPAVDDLRIDGIHLQCIVGKRLQQRLQCWTLCLRVEPLGVVGTIQDDRHSIV